MMLFLSTTFSKGRAVGFTPIKFNFDRRQRSSISIALLLLGAALSPQQNHAQLLTTDVAQKQQLAHQQQKTWTSNVALKQQLTPQQSYHDHDMHKVYNSVDKQANHNYDVVVLHNNTPPSCTRPPFPSDTAGDTTFKEAAKAYLQGDWNPDSAYGAIEEWCTILITDMSWLFASATDKQRANINPNITNWNTAAVTTMEGMFSQMRVFNGIIGSWNVSAVQNMAKMFEGASKFDQNIDAWDTSAVTTMRGMFYKAISFNQPIAEWQISSDVEMDSLFEEAANFHQDLCSWRLDFPYDKANKIFANSGCHYQVTPDADSKSPFCSDSCETLQPSMSQVPTPLYQPSALPSCSPSANPTESPSTEYGINLFYPDWDQNDGCRNDGNEPNYMAADPATWLSSSMQSCCMKWFFGPLYHKCIGNYPVTNLDDCVETLWYPDWDKLNKGCVDDGQEPSYMLTNKDFFLYETLEECCKRFYEWDYYTCTGTEAPLTHGKYYPNWDDWSSRTCLHDGEMPKYMTSPINQKYYLSFTLEECCRKHYNWVYNECSGNSDIGTNKWYANWTDKKCVQDCNGSHPCGGVANNWDELHSSKEECCEIKLYWIDEVECLSN